MSTQTQEDEKACEQGCDRGWKKVVNRTEETVYIFDIIKYYDGIALQDGYMVAIPRFDTRSELLKGVQTYRLTLARVNPGAFVVPSHRNADSICIVVQGQGSIRIIQQENTTTHNVELGDIMRIPAGSIVHFVNPHTDINLFSVLEIFINTPLHFELFFAPRSHDQDSFFNAFSNEILQAAFNLDKDQVGKLFQGRNGSVFAKASLEQIKALVESGDQQSSSTRPYNIFKQRPSLSNKYGMVHEVYPENYPPIQDLDVKVTYINITKGGIFGPYYNSRSSMIVNVIHGSGYIQMVCPPQREQITSYQKVRAQLLNGDTLIVPAGYPFVVVALEAKNLQMVAFEVRAQNNHRVALAGKNNILRQLGKEAKELSFNISWEQVDEILNRQQRSWFFPGPDHLGVSVFE